MPKVQISKLALWSMIGVGFLISVLITEEVARKVPDAYMVLSTRLFDNHRMSFSIMINSITGLLKMT
jgi:hypothetical protein